MSALLIIVSALLLAMIVLAMIGRAQYPWTLADTEANDQPPHGPYWYRLLVALDCFANAIAGGLVGETISARCGRWALVVKGHGTGWHWIARFMCKWLSVIQPDHGQRAIAGALGRSKQLAAIEQDALTHLTSETPEDSHGPLQ